MLIALLGEFPFDELQKVQQRKKSIFISKTAASLLFADLKNYREQLNFVVFIVSTRAKFI